MTEWGGVPHKEEGGEDRCGFTSPVLTLPLKVSTKFRGIFHNFTDKATSTVLSSSLIAPGRIEHTPLHLSTVQLLDRINNIADVRQ